MHHQRVQVGEGIDPPLQLHPPEADQARAHQFFVPGNFRHHAQEIVALPGAQGFPGIAQVVQGEGDAAGVGRGQQQSAERGAVVGGHRAQGE